ncbi:MAG: CPBP family intramembrane metalloprotease [Bacilli bacterium]|nr:CPBP family intramembrane metalloprotease [Bacilli bacterium]
MPENSYNFTFSFDLLLKILLSLCVAINEEYIFRMILIDNLDDSEKPMIKIIIAASIFAACHLTHFFSSFNPADLIIIVYTFTLGIVLGMIYVFGGSFWYCVLFHFIFNMMNYDFADYIVYGEGTEVSYYLINIAIGAIVAIYLVIIYFSFLHKKEQKAIYEC